VARQDGLRAGVDRHSLRSRLFWEILKVGLIASFSALTANLTAMLVTGLVARFGVTALAGLRHRRAPGIHAGATRLRHRLGPHHAWFGVAAGANDGSAPRAAWIRGLSCSS
jgi:hypothetical protein